MRSDTPKYIVEIARDIRKEQTDAENELWQRLRGRRLADYKFRRQYAIGRYIADFYCSEARLIIEIDGPIHQT
jgi:very-short-patch-repair endonuclease